MDWLKTIYNIIFAFILLIALLLIVSILPITGNIKFLNVKSGSMEPTIKVGSIVLVKPISTYKVGDIITFGKISKTQTPTTHRIFDIKVNVGQPIYITKGDANNAPDQKEISQSEVIGKVFLTIPYLGYAVAAARTKLGFALIIIIPAIAIIIEEISKIKKEIKKKPNVAS
ncbi:MAG: signal peptidase I [Candidatus Pacebacteria bacterium]|nr:signal peptidase I [Candidatus Paceibacterota bacterium]